MEKIGKIETSKVNEFLFYVDKFNNKLYAYIRKYVDTEKYTGPTNKGITITPANLKKIIDILEKNKQDFQNGNDKTKHTIDINDERHIKIAITPFRGNKYFELREYVKTKKYTGPTKKGININAKFFNQIHEYLKKMDNFLDNTKPEDVTSEQQ